MREDGRKEQTAEEKHLARREKERKPRAAKDAVPVGDDWGGAKGGREETS